MKKLKIKDRVESYYIFSPKICDDDEILSFKDSGNVVKYSKNCKCNKKVNCKHYVFGELDY